MLYLCHGTIKTTKNFLNSINNKIKKGYSITIYPEAHIWPYYTKIRPFKAVSFKYAVDLDKPVFCMTNTYNQSKNGKPRIVTYIDGPFLPNHKLEPKQRRQELRDRVYESMVQRSKNSSCEFIKYVKADDHFGLSEYVNTDNISKIEALEWAKNITNLSEKERLGELIAQNVKDGDVISFGSGTTSFVTAISIYKKIKRDNLKIKAVTTSKQIDLLCEYLGIQTVKIDETKIDWGFDGADEVDSNNWLIKGLGGAFYKEKINISKTPVMYILVDSSKLVHKLGTKCAVPVECDKEKADFVIKELSKLGANECSIRTVASSGDAVITDNGNYIIDAKFDNINQALEHEINSIDGVFENGLCLNYNNIEIVKL